MVFWAYQKECKNGEYWVSAEKLEEKRKYAESNKDKIAEMNRKYREANKEKLAEMNRKYREANKEKIAKRQRKYREENREKIAERDRKYCEANKDEVLERNRKYREENKEELAEKKRKYREANNEEIAERERKYREANKEEIAERERKYREANKEKIAEQDRKYREANKEKIAERQRKRYQNDPQFRAILEIRSHTKRIEKGGKRSLELYGVPTVEWVLKIKRGRMRIYNKYFKGVEKHLDHIRPLAEVMHSIEEMHKRSHFSNLLYIPAEANRSKGAKPFWEWFATLTDKKLIKCISEQDAYNKKIQRQLECQPTA